MGKRVRKGLAGSAGSVVDGGDAPREALVGFLTTHGQTKPGTRRGRPRKFSRPSTSVTLTLPDDVIAQLQKIDSDLSRAVVRAVQPLAITTRDRARELTMFGDKAAVILLPPSRSLMDHTGVGMVPLSDGRAMLAFDERTSVADFELRLRDAIAEPTLPADDKAMFRELAAILRDARCVDGLAMTQRSILVLHRPKAGNGGHRPVRRS
jgi:hypothetical protein